MKYLLILLTVGLLSCTDGSQVKPIVNKISKCPIQGSGSCHVFLQSRLSDGIYFEAPCNLYKVGDTLR